MQKPSHIADLVMEHRILVSWLSESALPFWSRSGVDTTNGGFYEQISQDGSVIDQPRRTRLVARQIFVFATAADLGWMDRAEASALVRSGLDFLLAKCCSEGGPVFSTVGPDGIPLGRDFDLYDHAFALFGLGTAARLGHRRTAVVTAAEKILEAMMSRWRHPVAGFEESSPPREPLNANPHMHLLEAFLEWEDAGEVGVWTTLADECAQLALNRFIDSENGVIREHFDHDWHPARGQIGRFVEPGHQYEWAWLLSRWALSRGHDVSEQSRRLVAIGEDYGVNEFTGLAINGIWDDLSVRDDNSRLWPQTERVKAHIALAGLTPADGRAHAIDHVVQSARGLRRYFETKVNGLWHETLDAQGKPIPGPARASSLYHIVFAIRELDTFVTCMAPG